MKEHSDRVPAIRLVHDSAFPSVERPKKQRGRNPSSQQISQALAALKASGLVPQEVRIRPGEVALVIARGQSQETSGDEIQSEIDRHFMGMLRHAA